MSNIIKVKFTPDLAFQREKLYFDFYFYLLTPIFYDVTVKPYSSLWLKVWNLFILSMIRYYYICAGWNLK